MIFRWILWLGKEWLYRDASWELPCTFFSNKRRIIKGQSHEINDFSQDSMAGEGVAVPGRELGTPEPPLRQIKSYKGTVS